MPPKGASVICERRQESACWSRQAEDAGSARVPARQASATAARQPSYPGSRPPTQLRHFFLPGEAHRILARVGHAAARKLRGGVDGGVRDGGVGPRLEVLRDQAGCGTRDTRLRGGGAGAWQHQRAVQGRAQAGRASPARAARLTVGVAAARHAYTTWPAQFFLPLSTRVFSAPVQAAAAQPVAVHWLGAPGQVETRGAAGGGAEVVVLEVRGSWRPAQDRCRAGMLIPSIAWSSGHPAPFLRLYRPLTRRCSRPRGCTLAPRTCPGRRSG